MPLTDSDMAKLDELKHSKTWGALKDINFSTVIAIVGLVVGGFGAYYSLVARQALNEAEMRQQKEFLMSQDAAIMAVVVRMGSQFDRMEAKMDRVIEMRKP